MKENINQENHWDKLADEMKYKIFSFFSYPDLAHVAQVDKKDCYRLSHEEKLVENAPIDYRYFAIQDFSSLYPSKIAYIKSIDKLVYWWQRINLFQHDLNENKSESLLTLGCDDAIRDVMELSNDRILIHYENRKLEIYDLKTRARIHHLLYPAQQEAYNHAIRCIAELSDGRIIYSDNRGPVYIWNLTTNAVVKLSSLDQTYATAIVPLPDNRVVTSTFLHASAGYLTVWYRNKHTNKTASEIWSQQKVNDVIAMPNFVIAACYDDKNHSIRFYDQKSGEMELEKEINYRVEKLIKISDEVFAVKGSVDNKRFVEFWSLPERSCLHHIPVASQGFYFDDKVIPLPDEKVLVGNKVLHFKPPRPALLYKADQPETSVRLGS